MSKYPCRRPVGLWLSWIVLVLLVAANFRSLPPIVSVSNVAAYYNVTSIDNTTTMTTSSNKSATVSISRIDHHDPVNKTMSPFVAPKTIVPTSSNDEDDALTWNITVNATGSFKALPVFAACAWYGAGHHRRGAANHHPFHNMGNNKTIATQGQQGIPKHVALPPSGKIRLVLNLPCDNLLKHECGVGNWVLHTYLMRMAAMYSHRQYQRDPSATRFSKVQMICEDINVTNHDQLHKTWVLPWLTGTFSGLEDLNDLQNYWKNSTTSAVARVNNMTLVEVVPTQCTSSFGQWTNAPILYMLPLIRQDLRRLAVQLVGPPPDNPNHPAHAFLQTMQPPSSALALLFQQQQQLPLLTNVELDDVAIHFRCGDIMASSTRFFHFIKFRPIVDLIPVETTRSIGIVTQPFPNLNNSQTRWRDVRNNFASEMCIEVTYAFQQYLQKRFPTARISIRNGKDESVALAYARFIMAQHAFAAPDSTFSIFPVLATFGKGYQPIGNISASGMNKGLTRDRALVDDDPHVFFMDPGTMLPAARIYELKRANQTIAREEILKWFRIDDYSISN